MIVTYILTMFVVVIGAIPALLIDIFPQLNANVLPFGIDAILVQGMGYIYFLVGIIPPLELMLQAFIYVIMWKLALKLIAMLPIIRGILHRN